MNFLDVLIIIAMVAVFAVVFFSGLSRALAGLVALWLGLVAADIFGGLLGRLLYDQVPGIERWTADVIGFLLALIISMTLILYVTFRSFRTLSARSGYRFDVRGGALVLLATILLAAVVALASVTVVVQVTARTIDDIPRDERPGFAVRQYEDAALRPATERIASHVYDATGSWVPGGAPSLLAPED